MNILALQSFMPSAQNGKKQATNSSLGAFGDLLSSQLTGTNPLSSQNGNQQTAAGLAFTMLQSILDQLNMTNPADGGNSGKLTPQMQTDDLTISDVYEQMPIKMDKSSVDDLMAHIYELLTGMGYNLPFASQPERKGLSDVENSSAAKSVTDGVDVLLQKYSTLCQNLLESDFFVKAVQNTKYDTGQLQSLIELVLPTVEDALKGAKQLSLLGDRLDTTVDMKNGFSHLKNQLNQLKETLNSHLSQEASFKGSAKATIIKTNNWGLDTNMFNRMNQVSKSVASDKLAKTNGDQPAGLQHNPFVTPSKIEQFVWSLPMKSNGSVNEEQLAKSFESIMNKANFSMANGTQKLLLKLNPEHLGSIRIELIQKDGIMVAKIMTSSSAAKEMLDNQLQGLKQSLANQHIAVEKVEITQAFNAQPQDRHMYREQGQQQQEQNRNNQQQSDSKEEEQFLEEFLQAIEQGEVKLG
ncbi:flagellar hook-length control protein FliK [Bacillus sp. 1P06AnD]|uniref:flagellar hook-length control protein FliK n=1 Tax=Bacillus sp. 1P06AnD TaxID=3132208 RepID=UPI0039A02A77